MACEIDNAVGVAQSRGSIGAGHRLEAYATLLLRLAEEFCKVVLGYSEMEGSVESCRIT